MEVGIPKEVKDKEARVGATPQMVRSLIKNNHKNRLLLYSSFHRELD